MPDKKLLVFIGDSLTEFFDWQSSFPACDVLNLGVSGETVEGLLVRLDRIIPAIQKGGRNPDFIFVMTGINNIAMEDYEIIAVYREVIRAIAASFSGSKLVIQSILPVRIPWIDGTIIRQLNESLKQMAKDFKAEYLDLYSIFMSPGSEPKKEYLLDDGVHVSDKGYKAWSSAVDDYLKSRL
ncbi:MAG: GDSL family lipase [Nitrospirae bacterium]|nr:GDSL family lipase [Nitrospirota bacterium]